jgi:ABC-type transport system substrate-binding protein
VLVILGGGNSAVLLQEQLKAVGIESEIVTGAELIEERTASGDFDIRTEGGWIVNTIRNTSYWVGNCETDLWPVRYHWCNEAFRVLAKEIDASTADPELWTRKVEELMKLYFDDGPVWAVTQTAEFYAVSDALGGFVPEESYNYIGTCGDKGFSSWYWEY